MLYHRATKPERRSKLMLRFAALIFIFIAQGAVLLGLESRACFVADPIKHAYNQRLLAEILERELAGHGLETSNEQAQHLSLKINTIAAALLKAGFSKDAYAVPALDPNAILSFSAFALWEGEKNGYKTIPLTFFCYVWPSEHLALRYQPADRLNNCYASNIHSHPIPCAFAVLHGTLIQNNFEQVLSYPKNMARFLSQDYFNVCEGEVDDLNTQKIHQLYNRGDKSDMSLSLHAYGISSADQVMTIFRSTREMYAYEILNKGM